MHRAGTPQPTIGATRFRPRGLQTNPSPRGVSLGSLGLASAMRPYRQPGRHRVRRTSAGHAKAKPKRRSDGPFDADPPVMTLPVQPEPRPSKQDVELPFDDDQRQAGPIVPIEGIDLGRSRNASAYFGLLLSGWRSFTSARRFPSSQGMMTPRSPVANPIRHRKHYLGHASQASRGSSRRSVPSLRGRPGRWSPRMSTASLGVGNQSLGFR